MLLWGGVAFALLWGLFLLGPVLTPFVAGAILAYILEPGVEWLRRLGCPRGVGAALVIALVMLLAILLALILVPLFTKQVNELSLKVPTILTVLLALPASAVLLVALRRVWTLYFTSGFYQSAK